MQLEIFAFGITKDIVGSTLFKLDVPDNCPITDLKAKLYEKYPKMEQLKSLLIAVNEEYGNDNYILKEGDEIALIPPVSGG